MIKRNHFIKFNTLTKLRLTLQSRINYELIKIKKYYNEDLEKTISYRKFLKKGYNILSKKFFVFTLELEDLSFLESNEKLNNFKEDDYNEYWEFDNFDSYYKFVKGGIYNNAYYFKYAFTEKQIKKYKLDISKINFILSIKNLFLLYRQALENSRRFPC